MNKKEDSSTEEVENTSHETSDAEEITEETSVPLTEYEKIKDDYLMLAAEFDILKKTEKKRNIALHLCLLCKLSLSSYR